MNKKKNDETVISLKLPKELLLRIDEAVFKEGYTSRQEFIRDVIRQFTAIPKSKKKIIKKRAEKRIEEKAESIKKYIL